MGFRISWISFLDTAPEAALAVARLADEGVADEANKGEFSGASTPSGYLLWVNDPEYLNMARLADFSIGRTVIGCQIHEGVMFSSARLFRYGHQCSSIVHDAQQNLRHLDVNGETPGEFPDILARMTQKQDAEDADEAEVDYYFEIPLLTAKSLCGFKHDEIAIEPAPVFTALRQLDAPGKAKTGLLRRLFG